MAKVKVTNTGQRARSRLGHTFLPGRENAQVVEVNTGRDRLVLSACRDLQVEPVEEKGGKKKAASKPAPEPASKPAAEGSTEDEGGEEEPPAEVTSADGDKVTATDFEWWPTVPEARSAVKATTDVDLLVHRHAHETLHPEYEGGRSGVLNAIEERLGELGVDDPEERLARE